MVEDTQYILVPSRFGAFGLVWKEVADNAHVQRVLLPREGVSMESLLHAALPGIKPGGCPAVENLAEQMRRFLAGEPVALPLDLLALGDCSPFQRRVLLAEYQIPRGWVSTYGLIARHLGVPGGARAVGGALARNPFPIIIPCHRAIASDGSLGGYQGGLAMKRSLLEMEGMQFGPNGRIVAQRLHYQT